MKQPDPSPRAESTDAAEPARRLDVSANAVILRRQDIAKDAALLHVAPVGWDLPVFEPGQYATLGLRLDDRTDESLPPSRPVAEPHPNGPNAHDHESDRLLRRAYSIASAPSTREYLEFYIVRVEHGRFTTRLWAHRAGDRLWLDPKIRGRFTLEHVRPTTDLIMVATGTGIAPYMSMLREYQGRGRWHRAALIHGVRFVADLAYRNEMERRAANDPAFAYVPTVTREPTESPWRGLRGRVQSLLDDPEKLRQLTGIALDPARCDALLCGNPDMIQDVRAMLESHGFQARRPNGAGNIQFERYW